MIAAAVLVTACSGSDDPGAELEWREPPDYSFVIDSACGERAFFGRFAVEVRDHAVADVTALDDSAAAMLQWSGSEQVPTIGMLLDELARARMNDAQVAAMSLDSMDGYPARIDIDWDIGAIDDEACYAISEYNEQ
jgi:hypothetical protein